MGLKKRRSQSRDKVLLAITIATFIIFASLLNFVNIGGQEVIITGNQVETSFISDLFTNWSEGNLDINIAKYLFWIILTVLIFASFNFAKFPDSVFLQALIAIPVGFLVTAYITPAELFTVLTVYSALGLTLSVILPFAILLFFSSMLLSNEKIKRMTVGKILLQVSIWALFVGFMIYKVITGFSGALLSTGASIVMLSVLGLSLLILVFNQNFRNWVRNVGLEIRRAEADVERAARRIERAAGADEEPR